jgi:hypothetical protein
MPGCPISEVLVLGPLPRLHLVSLFLVSVAVFLGAGLWLGSLGGVPVTWSAGAVLGALAGITAAWAFVHDFGHGSGAQPARVVRRP